MKIEPATAVAASHAVPVRQTRAARLRSEIADDIVSGALAPGVALDEMELARRFQVSRTPVREAIRLLAASGLVQARAHRSAVVARPSAEELTAMFEALQELEALCAGLAAARMSVSEVAALSDINATLLGLVHHDDKQRYHEINEAFHAAIYAGAHNSHLAEMTAATRDRISPFSRLQFRADGRLERSCREHDAIVRAIRRGDQHAAAAAMRAHIGLVHASTTAAQGLRSARPRAQKPAAKGLLDVSSEGAG